MGSLSAEFPGAAYLVAASERAFTLTALAALSKSNSPHSIIA
jgi:hypothetical protein